MARVGYDGRMTDLSRVVPSGFAAISFSRNTSIRGEIGSAIDPTTSKHLASEPSLGASSVLGPPNFPLFYLLQCGLLEGQPDRRVVGILEIGPLDHHDQCDAPLHVDPDLSTVASAVAEGSGREHSGYTLRLADDAYSQPPAVAGSKAGDQIASLDS
jgi:hypothetical protein